MGFVTCVGFCVPILPRDLKRSEKATTQKHKIGKELLAPRKPSKNEEFKTGGPFGILLRRREPSFVRLIPGSVEMATGSDSHQHMCRE